MKLIRTVVFILLFMAAGAIYLYQVRLGKQVLVAIPDEVNRSVVISPADEVSRMEVIDHLQKTQIILKKESGAWTLDRPVRYPAERGIPEGLVAAARMASKQPRLRAEKEWEEYGLAKPELEILFTLPQKKPAVLLLGAKAPVGKMVFARWKDERGYFLLPMEMKSAFHQSVYGLREKRLFRTPSGSFRKIYVEMGKNAYQWKKDGGSWYWLEPVGKFGQKVPPERMEQVLTVLRGLHIKEFQDNNKKSKAELGFFMIHDRILVESEGGKNEMFYFGNEVPDRNAYYGFREGENTVFLVDRGKVIELFDLMKKLRAEGGERLPVLQEKKTDGEELVSPPSTILLPSS